MPDSAIRRRLLESRMEARESQLQLAAMQCGCGTWTLEPVTGELHCSARALSMLGLAADTELRLDTLLHLVHPGDRQRLSNTLAHALSVRDRFQIQFGLAGGGTSGQRLRCFGSSHSSALDADRYALSGILVPVVEDKTDVVTLDSKHLAAAVLRMEGLCDLERSTMMACLQSEMLPKARSMQQRIATLASDPALTSAQRMQTETVLDKAADLLNTLRALIFNFQPPGVAELGFCGALERYARDTAASAALELTLSLPDEPLPLPEVAQEALYRAACAGMDNVAIHAHARHMSVTVCCDQTGLILEIGDDGDGIRRTDLERSGALGLFTSSARLVACNAALRIRNRPGGGTLLQISAALDQENQLQRRAGAAS